MKFACSLVATYVLLVSSALSTRLPDFSFHWNNFKIVQSVNGFLLGVSDNGLTVLQYDEVNDNYSQGETLLLEESPIKLKAYGDSLLIQTVENQIYIVDFSDAPRLTLISTITPQTEFYDFGLYQESVYLACGFDGIERVSAATGSDGRIIDYSRKGVLVTQVDILGNQLIALDQYNGLITYDLNGAGFGSFNQYLYLEHRAYRFDQMNDSSLIILNQTANALVADREQGNLTIDGTLAISSQPLRTFVTDDAILLVSARSIDKYSRTDLSLVGSAVLGHQRVEGTIVNHNGKEAVIFPNDGGGLARVDLDDLSLSSEVLARAGTIKAIAATSRELVVASERDNLRAYVLNGSETPAQDYWLQPFIQPVSAVTAVGDTIIAIYPDEENLFTINRRGDPETIYAERFDLTDAVSIKEMKYIDSFSGRNSLLLMRSSNDISIYHLEHALPLSLLVQCHFSENVNDVALCDSLLAVAYGYNVELYAVDSTLALTHLSTRAFNTPASRAALYDQRMITVDGNELMLWDVSEPILPHRVAKTELDQSVADIKLVGHYLFVVGQGGSYVIDLSGDQFSVNKIGSLRASMLAWVNGVLLTSDGTSIQGYRTDLDIVPPGVIIPETYALYQNYPNPFNNSTVIEFDLPQASYVTMTIYNSLGRRVTTLIDRTMEAGKHAIRWDGANSSGESAASGIYFYRLKSAKSESTRKMVLLK